MHLFAALDCVRVAEQKLDPQEAITVHSVPMHEIMPLVHAGLIDASTTVSGLLLAFDYLRARGLLE
jgi:hypothetical protein